MHVALTLEGAATTYGHGDSHSSATKKEFARQFLNYPSKTVLNILMKYFKLNRTNIKPSKSYVYFQVVPNEHGEHVLLFSTLKINKVSKFTEIIPNTINLVKIDTVKSE